MRTATRAALFTSIGVLLVGILAAVSDYFDPVYPEMRARRDLIREQENAIEAVSFGSSHAAALDFEELGLRGFHLWNGGSDLHENAFLASELLPRLSALRCIFVAVSPYQLEADNGVESEGDRRGRRRELYAGTWSLRHLPGDRRSWAAGKAAVVAREDHWRRVGKAILSGRLEASVERNGQRSPPAEALAPELMQQHGIGRAERHRSVRDAILERRPDAMNRGHESLRRLTETATSRGAGVVLYTPPFHHTYLQAVDTSTLQELRRRAGLIAEENARVVYGDFSDHPEFSTASDLFRNSDHLNVEGGRRFMNFLRPLAISACDE